MAKLNSIKFPNDEVNYEIEDKNAIHTPQDATKIGLFREFKGNPQYSMDNGMTWKEIGGNNILYAIDAIIDVNGHVSQLDGSAIECTTNIIGFFIPTLIGQIPDNTNVLSTASAIGFAKIDEPLDAIECVTSGIIYSQDEQIIESRHNISVNYIPRINQINIRNYSNSSYDSSIQHFLSSSNIKIFYIKR